MVQIDLNKGLLYGKQESLILDDDIKQKKLIRKNDETTPSIPTTEEHVSISPEARLISNANTKINNSSAPFDAEKVNRLRDKIKNGEFDITNQNKNIRLQAALKIASKMLDFDVQTGSNNTHMAK